MRPQGLDPLAKALEPSGEGIPIFLSEFASEVVDPTDKRVELRLIHHGPSGLKRSISAMYAGGQRPNLGCEARRIMRNVFVVEHD
jgi:hypothetical protein